MDHATLARANYFPILSQRTHDIERNSMHIAGMNRDDPRAFSCPYCQAGYKIVRMKCVPGTAHRMLQCTVCQHELAPTEGDDILKYFLVSRPRAESRTSRI